MYHVPYKSLLAILGTVKELGGQSNWMEIHETAKLYRSIHSTKLRLEQLTRLELLHQQSNGKEFDYFLSAKGKQLLNLTKDEQIEALKRRKKHSEAPRMCRICSSEVELTWCRDGFYCPVHLNADYERPQLRLRTASSLASW